MADNKVKVKIYGQEYTISGERDEQTIIEIAEYVDTKMREISRFFSSTVPGSLAVLSAVNIADELFDAREEAAKIREEKAQLERDAENYMKMWDEAKKSFASYKEGASKASEDMKELEDKCRALEERCSEFESSYFDVQMENIRLKDQLEKIRKVYE
ncbi:MAG: cell division protein ZapA [Firmicutes bacterium]|nr:cell division protein ZapA [Bacillota bacterium]MBR3706926.1 cell division protein ZapA [Bacillota bacterium]